MDENNNFNLNEVDRDILEKMKFKRKQIITDISDLPSSKRETIIKNLDELIKLASRPPYQ